MKTADNPTLGIMIMASAMLVAPFMDLFAKWATDYVVPGEVALGRFAAQTILLIPVVFLVREWCWPKRAHLLAGVCAAIAILSINSALKVMPIANAIAIFFVEPLILTLLSAWILGERLGWRRLTAVSVGLVGALIVLRPNVELYGWAAVYPLITAFAFAGYMIIMRVLSPGGGRIAMQFWMGATAALVLLGVLVLGTTAGVEALTLTVPPIEALCLFLAAGGLACLIHQMIAQALARAEAGALAPLQYLEIVGATSIGLVFFSEFPDQWTLIGTLIIIASGIYVFHRERQVARAA
ncbi:MAG: DMT family transporter [Pseudomonadota bacterium]